MLWWQARVGKWARAGDIIHSAWTAPHPKLPPASLPCARACCRLPAHPRCIVHNHPSLQLRTLAASNTITQACSCLTCGRAT